MDAGAILTVGRLSDALARGLAPWRPIATKSVVDPSDAARAGANGVRAIICGGSQRLPAAALDAFPALELIAVHGVGIDGLDLAALRARGIAVSTTPDVLTDDVAELAIGLLLAVTRRIAANDRFVRDGRWCGTAAPPLGSRLRGRSVGLLGMGRIGQAIADRLAGFGTPCSYTARRERPLLPHRWYPDVRSLAVAVDILIVAAPGQSGTPLVDGAVIEALGVGGVLVNVGRGSVVDEGALLAALEAGRLAGAGLDVFADEPGSASRFAHLDTVVLQPHQGSATHAARQAMADLVLANLSRWFAEGRLVTPVA